MKQQRHIIKIVFHWSESVKISTAIDPDYNNIFDANFIASCDLANRLFEIAVDELKQRGKCAFETCVTAYFSDGLKEKQTFHLSVSKPNVDDYFSLQSEVVI